MKQGVILYSLSTVPQHAFEKLREISLCIHCVPATWETDRYPPLAAFLNTADELQHWNLSLHPALPIWGQQSLPHIPLTNLLPQQCFSKLHTLALDGLCMGEAELASSLLL